MVSDLQVVEASIKSVVRGGNMERAARILVWICLVASPTATHAQVERGPDNDNLNTNLGFTWGAPLNPTANYEKAGWGLDFGSGYNFDRHNAVIGDFMWNWITVTPGAINPLRTALNTREIAGHGNIFALTANYRLEQRGRKFGVYFIGGGGWYYRLTTLTNTNSVPTPAGVTCDPVWLWWGYKCSAGKVNASQKIGSSGEGAFGVDGGVGFTIRVGDAPYRFYAESRYNYAPTKNTSTQFIAVTVGFRY